ncbi:transglutaminase-like domain-containing protein [Variovorax sp. PCZ-1]|uniref:transglutaminase-like domain-containing protein n=1 Tax=Variovorax sp. PCZ-1 TaxID=2835533 RepID=UPI001BCDE55F|nr:transglutaminase-like domain-containing protein [Variovorax sp. PCZ-1]MBS7807038.1 transglutaminase domain-containing protein [Variovorax sp. PCZ-1]
MSAHASHPMQDNPQPASWHLSSTALIQAGHPRITALAKDITRAATSEVSAAVLIHDWVRDEIAFGIPSGFYDTTAIETLDAKLGYCNTKASLFQALLRARSIPTRTRMMDLSAQVLKGVLDPGTAYVDHAITEVFLQGRWIQVDSYVVDSQLANVARRKLSKTSEKAGFGVHINGSSRWDGTTDSLIQCLNDGSIKDYVLKDHGLFADVADFYQRVQTARNRKTLFSAVALRLGHGYVNRQIQSVRDSA